MPDAHPTSGDLTRVDSPGTPGSSPDGSPGSAPGSGEATTTLGGGQEATKERCRLLDIKWLEQIESAQQEAVDLLDADAAVRLRVVPVAIEGGRVTVAMIDPLDADAADETATLVGRPITRVGLDQEPFTDLMRAHYGTTAARIADALAGDDRDQEQSIDHNLDAIEADDIHRMAEQPTLINLVNLLLLEAIQTRASDVHIEPFESELKVRYRVDGVLHEQPPPPKHLQPALIGRIKIMSGMNIAERYVPQDGHISLKFEGRKVDIRVSTVPTLYGESVVMRILDKSSLRLDLDSLGMRSDHQEKLDQMIAKPHGMVLVTGPTGSGKTTTLYACLTKLNSPQKKVITVEDPVEYELHGINQMPVNPKRGLTFASGLRSILRQDPDVIFVGEIRDNETADIAIRSALTGHLVFSTLHTNDAISSVGRLVDMDAEPFLVASVIEGLLAQRLGRRVCGACRHQIPMPDDLAHRVTPNEHAQFNGMVWIGKGCTKCNNTGYTGRIGFFELIEINATLRKAISEGMSTADLMTLTAGTFMTMREDGMIKAAQGLTTINEVLRATQDSQE